ncbi:MAG: hypothetical protein PUB21_08050 [Bacteroidales bacterium]|nr:hypothetical protein [Bacteroidales bacterium]
MGGDKTFVFTPESGTGGGGLNSILAMIPGMLQGKGGNLDPNLVAALMNGRNNQDAWGGGGCWWIWIILLFFIWGGWGGNGFGNNGANGLPNQLNNDAGRELLMQAIQGNGTAINQLASSLNCSTQQLQSAICNIQGSIDKVAGQVGMTGQQVINSIQSMGCQIGNQIADCCCQTQNAITRQGYENQLATLNQTNTLTSNANTQFNIIGAKIDAQTQILNDKFCQLEMREMQNKIDTLRSEKAALEAAALTQAQTANILNQLKPCPNPAYIVPNPNCCYGNSTVVFNDGNGCGC